MPLGSKLALPWASQVEHGNKDWKFYNSSSLKLDGLELWYFVCSVSLWSYTKFIDLGVTSWSIGTKKTNFKIFLLWKWEAYSFDFWYVASPNEPLPSLLIWCPWGQNWPCPGGHMLEHRNKDSKLQNFSSLKLEGAELWYLVCSISFWTSTKFVHMMPLGSILAPPLGSQDGT